MLEGFKYIKNISANEATILLYNQIGDSVDSNGNYKYGISGSSFANEIQYLSNQENVSTINVRINSTGGSVLDGYSIVSAILNSPKKVNTFIDGLAASTAGWIAVAGKKCTIVDFGTFMLHNPSGGEDNKVLNLVRETIVTILSNRTKKTPEEISVMMANETWLSSNEALAHGIVDEIITTEKKFKAPKQATLNELAFIYNQLIETKMSKVNEILKLKNEATETEQVEVISKFQKTISENETEISDLKNRLKVLEDEKVAKEAADKAELVKNATALAETAFKAGKITESEKKTTIENASKDAASFTFVSNMISKLVSKQPSKIFNIANVSKESSEDKNNWTYADWQKKDMAGLNNLFETDKEKYNELLKNHKKK